MQDINFEPTKLGADAIFEKEAQFLSIFGDPAKRDLAWLDMHGFFEEHGADVDFEYYPTYFRWYTELSWKLLNSRDIDAVIDILVPRQIPMAFMLGIDVWDKILDWLYQRGITPKEMSDFYVRLKNNVKASEAIIGKENGEYVRFGAFYQEAAKMTQQADDVRRAEYYARLQKIVTSNVALIENIPSMNPEDVVDQLVGLVNFFEGISGDDIFYVADARMFPQKYDETVQQETTPESSTEIESVQEVNPDEEKAESESAPEQSNKQTKHEKTALADVQSLIESRFTKDDSGQFTNIEGVMTFLDNLATERGDDRIRELYYFDEDKEAFVWNDDLLNA